MQELKKIIYFWGPPTVWMILIFILSSRQRISVSDELTINFLVFKTLHVIEYAVLYFLLFRAINGDRNTKTSTKRSLLYAFIFSIIYAISDEIHQAFVPTREGKLRDVVIDTLGIYLMYSYIKKRKL